MSMRDRFRPAATAMAIATMSLICVVACRRSPAPIDAPSAAKAESVPTTSWGKPDLQGIWTRAYDIPLERPTKYANQEFFTDAERAELDRRIADIVNGESDESRRARGTERDVNTEFAQAPYTVHLPVGRRTSLIVDPKDGRIPPLTPEAKQIRDAVREYQLALLQPTASCKENHPGCAGGKYGPVSPRRNEMPPAYLSGNVEINRADGPEDRRQTERCIGTPLPDFGNFTAGSNQIVQSAEGISILYETGSGWNRFRMIPITTDPHPPAAVREFWGDSRGHWDGDSLVVDTTNFSPKSGFQGVAHENLHLVERWTRLDAGTLEYAVTIDDPTTWTSSWTVKQELKRQSDTANQIYFEPRCHEGNYGFAALLSGARAAERAYAEKRGPDPATLCIIIGGCGGFIRGGFADDGPDADPFKAPPRR
jgi:hypothetical protein